MDGWSKDAPPKVLIVDDDADVRRSLLRALSSEPYVCVDAGSAQEALGKLQNEGPIDVIIADESMPGMTGTELLERVAEQYPMTARLILTGHDDINDVFTAINKGILQGFLTKPCRTVDLALSIRRALEAGERETGEWQSWAPVDTLT